MTGHFDAGTMTLPLKEVRVGRTGGSRVGQRLVDLLVSQGATLIEPPKDGAANPSWATSEKLDVVIDDETDSGGNQPVVLGA